MKLSLALAVLILLLVPAWATAQPWTADPVPGVDVIVKKNSGPRVVFRTTTDADGAFALPSLEPGEYVIEFTPRALATGKLRAADSWTRSFNVGSVARVDLSAPSCAATGFPTVVLAVKGSGEDETPEPGEPATVTGRVTNASGSPELCLGDASPADATDVDPSPDAGLAIGAGFDDGRGHVTARTRGRFSAATVRGLAVTARTDDTDLILRTTTNADGNFVLANLAPGGYVLEIAEPGTTVRVGASLELRLVVSRNGLLIPNSESSPAGRIGAIALDPSDPSANVVFLPGASGGVWKSTSFPTVELTTEVTERGIRVLGRVTNAQGGGEAGLSYAYGTAGNRPQEVTARLSSSDVVLRTKTNDRGEFAFRNLAAGRYVLGFAQPREIPGAAWTIYVTPLNDAPRSLKGSTISYTGLEVAWTPRVDLTMEVDGRRNVLSGRVTNETTGGDCTSPPRSTATQGDSGTDDQLRGSAIPGVDVNLGRNPPRGNPPRGTFRATSDANGSFSFADLAPGQYLLELAQPASIPGAEMDVEVTRNGIASYGQPVTFTCLASAPRVELTMEDTARGNVLTGTVSNKRNAWDLQW